MTDSGERTTMTRRTVIGGAARRWPRPGSRRFPRTPDDEARTGKTVRLTVMGTTDLHGNVFNWDYFKNAEYDDSAHNDIGLAKISTLVTAVRDRIAASGARRARCCSTPATPSRAPRWRTTSPRSSPSPAATSTRWRPR